MGPRQTRRKELLNIWAAGRREIKRLVLVASALFFDGWEPLELVEAEGSFPPRWCWPWWGTLKASINPNPSPSTSRQVACWQFRHQMRFGIFLPKSPSSTASQSTPQRISPSRKDAFITGPHIRHRAGGPAHQQHRRSNHQHSGAFLPSPHQTSPCEQNTDTISSRSGASPPRSPSRYRSSLPSNGRSKKSTSACAES